MLRLQRTSPAKEEPVNQKPSSRERDYTLNLPYVRKREGRIVASCRFILQSLFGL
jgi:hypothetical protein